MADHSKPTLTSAYTDLVAEVDGRFDDLARALDPATSSPSNLPTNAIRFSSAAGKWQKFNGTAWADLASTYAINISGNAATVTNGVYTSGSYADPAWLTSIAGSKVAGNITGNAATATALATPRTINGVSFNGTSNISVNLNSNVTFNNAGSGAASGVTFNGGSAITISYNTVGAPKFDGTGASGTWPINISGYAAGLGATLGVSGGGTGLTSAGPAGSTLKSNGTTFVLASSFAAGGGSDAVFYENDQVVTTDYTISTGKNAMTAGPITISTGVTVTVPDDSSWSII